MKYRSGPWILSPGGLLIGLGTCFFGSLIWAASLFPHGYDWRHTVISSLASPRDNPHAYGIACAGLALSGLLLIPFVFLLEENLYFLGPSSASWASKFFLVGALCLTLSAVVVPGHYRILGMAHSHEHLAQICSVAFCLALILYWATIQRLPPPYLFIRMVASFLVIAPVTALVVSRLALLLTDEFFSGAVHHALKVSLWSSLALWEWVGAFCIYLFLGMVTLFLTEQTWTTD